MPEGNQTPGSGDAPLDSAIDEITKSDADKALAHDSEFSAPQPDKPKGLKAKLKDLWLNPKKRWSIIILLVISLAAAAIIPDSRYFILNTVGVRSSASITVLDESTGQPLKNAVVTIASSEQQTNQEGVASFSGLRLGKTSLSINKRAFADKEQTVTLGWGSNPLGNIEIQPVGLQYKLTVIDYLSGKPIEKAEASYEEFSAVSNENGEIALTIEDPGQDSITFNVAADGYRAEDISVDIESKETPEVTLVLDRKHIFVSKRSGKYDVYQSDLDSQNQELILSATGSEREDLALVSHPDKDIAALVSTRSGERTANGQLKDTLTLIDATGEEATTEEIATAERVQLIDWSGSDLVYVRIAEGADANSPDRHRLVSYNLESRVGKEIAKSNYFNDVLMVDGVVYYAPSSANLQDTKPALYKVNANGDDRQEIFGQEVWNIFRTSYTQIYFSVNNDWYEYKPDENKVLAADGAPAIQLSRLYVDAPGESNQSAWIDQRDGKGTLLVHNSSDGKDRILYQQGGLTYPVRWMSDSVLVFRLNSSQETADYAVSLDGGSPKKIIDVTNTGGVDRWYYY